MTELVRSRRPRRSARISASALLNDLVPPDLVDPADPRAVRIRGRLLDGAGDPVPDGMVEIWHADAAGSRTKESSTVRLRSPGTVDDGWFEFVTAKPGPVPAATEECRLHTSSSACSPADC